MNKASTVLVCHNDKYVIIIDGQSRLSIADS